MTKPLRDQKLGRGAVWFVSIFILVAVVAAIFLLRNQSSTPEPITITPQSWEIPRPNTDDMEPQVVTLIDETRDILVNNRKSAQAWGKYAMVLDAHRLHETAAVCYRRAYELAPKEFRWPYLLAISLSYDKTTFLECIEKLKDAAKLDSQYVPLYIRLGKIQLRHGMTTESQEAFQQILKLDPNNAMAHRGLGQVYLMLGDAATAVTYFERATEIDPIDNRAYVSLAAAYTLLKDHDRAQQALQRSKNLTINKSLNDPIRNGVNQLGVSSVACLMRADQYVRVGDYQSAIKEFTIAADARPYDATVHLDLAKTYRKIGDFESVIIHLKSAVEIQDDLVDVHIVLGDMILANKDYDQAIHHYRRAAAHAPDKPLIHTKLAGALARNGDFEQALEVFNHASDLGPLDASSNADWGTTLLSTGNFISAVNRFEDALQLNPDHVASHAGLGAVFEQLGQFDEAIAEYEITLSLDPQHPARQRLDRLRASQNTP